MAVVIIAALTLLCPQFGPGGTLGDALVWNADGCHGANRSPALRWTNPPRGTKGFALRAFDPDAGPAGWWHWIVYDIPATRRELPAALPPNAVTVRQGVNDFGAVGYGGPCPPPGPIHHYVFTLYALDVARLGADSSLRGRDFVNLVRPHVVATATLTGVYRR